MGNQHFTDITVSQSISLGATAKVEGNIIPDTDDNRTLGDATHRYAEIHTRSLTVSEGLGFAAQTSNTFYGGPAAAPDAAPAFRALVAADVPSLAASKITTGQLALARGGTAADLSASGSATAFLAQSATQVISARSLVAADVPSLAASILTSGQVALARGGTNADLSASGAATHVLAQDAAHVVSARALISADIPNNAADTSGKAAKTDALNSATTVVNVSSATAPSAGQILQATSSTAATWQSRTIAIPFVIDGGAAAITAGEKGHLEIPFACTITGWTILADQSGSIVVAVAKDTYANFPPTFTTDEISGSEKPTLSSVQKNQDLSLSTWTTAVAAGDVLAYKVDSATTVTRVTVSIRATIP